MSWAKRTSKELTQRIAAWLVEEGAEVNGCSLVSVSTSTKGSSLLVTYMDRGIRCVSKIKVATETYSVRKALTRNDVRTPGPASGPMVPELRYSGEEENDNGNR